LRMGIKEHLGTCADGLCVAGLQQEVQHHYRTQNNAMRLPFQISTKKMIAAPSTLQCASLFNF